MPAPRRGSTCLLLTGLGAFLLLLSSWRIAGGSFSHGANNDPAYMYLFNGLLLLGGEAPFHVHHPGTPLQLLCAATTWLAWALQGGRMALLEFVVARHAEVLELIHLTMLLGMAATLAWALRGLSRQGFGAAGLLLMLGAWLSFRVFIMETVRIAPEMLLVPALSGATYCLWSSPNYLKAPPSRRLSPWDLGAAAWLGMGVVAKITFAPAALLLLGYAGLRRKGVMLAALVGFMALFLLPALASMGPMADWLWKLAFRQGWYDTGAQGMIGMDRYLANVVELAAGNPTVLRWLGLLAAGSPLLWLASARRPVARRAAAFLCALALFMLAQAVLTARHPMPRYLYPTYVAAGLSLPLLWRWSMESRGLARACGLGLLAALLLLLGKEHHDLAVYRRFFLTPSTQAHAQAAALERAHNHCVQIGVFGSGFTANNMDMANQFSGRRFAHELTRLLPDAYVYDISQDEFLDFHGQDRNATVFDLARRGRCLLLSGEHGLLDPLTGSFPQARFLLRGETVDVMLVDSLEPRELP